MDSQHRVEEVGQSDSLGLGDETEEMTVPVEGPRESVLNYLKAGLVISVEESSADEARMLAPCR